MDHHPRTKPPDHLSFGWHGHIIPSPDGLVAECGGPASCQVCEVERIIVVQAARGDASMVARCGGPGVCGRCRQTLLSTGIDLAQYAPLPVDVNAAEPQSRLYTLEEARRELAREECRQDGHDWDLITTRLHASAGETPIGVRCSRGCGHPTLRVMPSSQGAQPHQRSPQPHYSCAHYAHGWCGQCPDFTDQEELQAWRGWANLLLAAIGEYASAHDS